MRVKRILPIVILLIFLFLVLKSYHIKSLKETVAVAAARYGYRSEVEDAWFKLNGNVVFKGISLTDSLGGKISIKKFSAKSSLTGLLTLKKKAEDGTLDFSTIVKKVKAANADSITGSYRHSAGGLFRINNLSLESNIKVITVTMDAPNVEHGKITLKNGIIEAEVTPSMLTLKRAEFATFDGLVSVKSKIKEFKEISNAQISFNGIELHKLLNSEKIKGVCSGSFELDTLTLDDLSDIRRLYGTGKISVKDFREEGDVHFNTALHKLGRLGIKELDFSSIEGSLELRNGRVITEDLEFKNSNYRLIADGRYRIKNNSFNFKIEGYIKPALRSKMKPLIWDALLRTDTDERKFSGSVRGVPEKYQVSVDGKIVKRGINSFFNNIFH